MTDKPISLTRYPGGENQRQSVGQVIDVQKMDVGGQEGKKEIVTIGFGPNSEHKLSLVVKKPENFSNYMLVGTIRAYETARKDGFPVPETSRLFQSESIVGIALTDLTENGKYLVWGYNDHPSANETSLLDQLELSSKDKTKIREIGDRIVNLADKLGRRVSFYNYLLRKNTSSGQYDLKLLDLDKTFTPKIPFKENKKDLGLFMDFLSLPPSEHRNRILKVHF